MNKVDKLAKTLTESTEIKDKKKTSAYDTIAKVVRIDGNTAWVSIKGGISQTPATMVVNARVGEEVRVHVAGGKAYVTGNASAPPTDDARANEVMNITKYSVDYVEMLRNKDITVRSIEAATGYIDDLHAKNITTENLQATNGYIENLTSKNITAEDISADHATVGTLGATYAKITDLDAAKGRIDDLEANEVVVHDTLKATNANVEYLKSDWISTDRLVLTGNNKNNYPPVEITETEFNANKTAYWTKSGNTYTQCTQQSVYDSDEQYYVRQSVKAIIEAINNANRYTEAFPTQTEFNADKTNYYTYDGAEYIQCKSTDTYSSSTQYYIYDTQIIVSKDKLIAASMDVAELSAITADMGTITAGKIQKGNNFINLNTSPASMEFKNASTWANATQGLRWDTQGNLNIKGAVEISGGNVYTKTETDSAVSTAVDDIEVGGRNYCAESIYRDGGTITGIAFTYVGDGVWHISGTATADVTRALYFIINGFPSLGYGDTYTASIDSLMPSKARIYVNFANSSSTTAIETRNGARGSSTFTFECNENYRIRYLGINIQSGATVDFTCRMKLEKGNKATDWSPAPEDGSAVNLIPWPYYRVHLSGDVHTSNGITWTVNKNGSITATGTATADSWYHLTMENHPEYVNGEYQLPHNTYTLSGCPSAGSSTTCGLNISLYTTPATATGYNYYYDYGDGVTFTPTSAQKYARIQMVVKSGCTCPSGGYTFYPMLEVGGIKHSFVSPRVNEGAASTATSYITRINDAGIFISPSNQSPTTSAAGNSVRINASGMEVYKGGNSVAFYGSNIRLGEETSSRLSITSDGISAYTPNGVQLFSLNKNGGLKNQYARLKEWQTTSRTVNLSTTLGSAWTSLSAGQIFRIRGECCYETASDVGVAYAYPFEQFTKGTASTGTVITYDGSNTLTISTSGIPSGGTYEYSDLEFLKVDIVPAPFYSFADDAPTVGGANSFVVGTGTVAGNPNQLALGAYNAERLNGLLIIGGGTSSARKNLAVVTDTGDLYLKGNLYVGSNDAGTSGTKANSGIDIASKITFGSAWTQQVRVARRIGNMVFFQLEANAGSFNANTNYVLANIASGYRPAVQQFATGITTDSSYNPKGTVSAVLKTDGTVNIRTQAASSSGAYVFVSGFYYTA